MELVQVRLVVSDFSRAFRFYRDVLGLTPQVDDDRGPYAKLSPSEGHAAIALHARDDLKKSLPAFAEAHGDRALVVLKVANVDAEISAIRARGGVIAREPEVAWGRLRVAYLKDPDGNWSELQQWL